MESTGESNRIQLSQTTADRLTDLGRGTWIREREDLVQVKGKGLVKTYWLASRPSIVEGSEPKEEERFSLGDNRRLALMSGEEQISTRMGIAADISDSEEEEESEIGNMMPNGNMSTVFENQAPTPDHLVIRRKVINWQSELLLRALRLIAGRRPSDCVDITDLRIMPKQGAIVIDEVVESIELPEFDARAVKASIDPGEVRLSPAIITQVHDYVTMIASMYPNNAFHNFEHATHVAMSASKLLSGIVVPDCTDVKIATELHISTDGINSDPLTQFAVVFAALIHDVDHPGVPNDQLAKEDPTMAEMYKYQSIAEQKSVDISWDLLMDPKYLDLRACIYTNESELRRFRQLVVNCVMATDIFDKDMKEFRETRFEKVFGEESYASEDFNMGNRRATIVIEHISQVSDVAHTMQHWHVYRKWNERLFEERVVAFRKGRAEKDPAEIWYEEELWFFDNYTIPLAKRLHECEVFGVASNECLSYAMDNRAEWAAKGHEVVREMVEANSAEEDNSWKQEDSFEYSMSIKFNESTSMAFEELNS
jgi:hypothetical protein